MRVRKGAFATLAKKSRCVLRRSPKVSRARGAVGWVNPAKKFEFRECVKFEKSLLNPHGLKEALVMSLVTLEWLSDHIIDYETNK